MHKFLACVVTILWYCQSQLIQITSTGASLSNNNTLVPSVTYDLNFSLSAEPINSAATLGILFSERFNINAGTLSNCRTSTSAALAPAPASSCTVTYYPGSKIYEVMMTGVFQTTGSYSFLRMSFVIDNPYAARD